MKTHTTPTGIEHGLTVGQEITWRLELSGGYGKIILVKGIVVKLNPKRCRIAAQLKAGGTKETNVDYSNIKESKTYLPIKGLEPDGNT